MKDVRSNIIFRMTIFFIIVMVGFVMVVVKTVKLKVIDGPKYTEKISKTITHESPVLPIRGDILAVDGRKLACSVPEFTLAMDPSSRGLRDDVFDEGIDSLAICLSKLYRDNSAAEYKRKITSARQRGQKYLVLNTKHVSYSDFKKAKEFPIFRKGQFKGGFLSQEHVNRKMPFGMLAGRTIGKLYGEKERGGMLGIELSYDQELRGKTGVSIPVRVAGTRINEEIVAPVDGKNVVTTIDVDMQDVAENSLLEQLEHYGADHGVAILMEVKTGAVRAMVNLHREQNGSYSEDYLNFAISESAEPGSTFKLATLMACLEDGIVNVDDTINTFAGEYKFFDRIMRDSKKGGHGIITIEEAFAVSSNIAFSRLVWKNYEKNPQRFIDRLHNLGLADSLGIDLVGAGTTKIKNYGEAGWSGTTLPWMSIGYELQMTPLQILSLYNAVANGGTMMRPMFVESIMDHGEVVEKHRPKVLRNSIASHRTIETVQALLKEVVQNGTATNIKKTPYGIAGKTGTAQIAQGGKYSKNGEKKYLASFAGYFPADAPQYSCIVMVYAPSSGMSYYGNVVAGNVVKAIADRVYASEIRKGKITAEPKIDLTGVFPYSKGGQLKDLNRVLSSLGMRHNNDVSTTWVSSTAKSDRVQLDSHPVVVGKMPDVRGMGASDAVALLESKGLVVKLSGYGHVVTQSIPHDSEYKVGESIILVLKNG